MKVTFIVIAMFLVLCATPVYAQVPLPHAFWGSVEINGSDAPAGTHVKATGDGVNVPMDFNPIITENTGQYGGPAWNDPKLLVQGDIEDGAEIEFYVSRDGVTWVKADTEPAPVYWHSGEITRVDLTATITGGGGGGGADTTPPAISAVSLCPVGVTETTADICWTTNEPGTSQVEYWASPGTLSTLDETLVIDHHVYLTGLTPATTYHYKTMSKDAAGNVAVSDEHSFTTLGASPEGAAFTPGPLSISPTEVDIGGTVSISISVANTGGQAGSYTVTLKINSVVEETREVIVAAGASETVTFTTSRDEAGTYAVDVNGLTGSFTVKEAATPPPPPPPTKPTNWPLIGGIIGGVIVVGLAIFYFLRRRAD